MAIVADVFKAVRTHLDDDDAALWTDPRLMPKLQIAHQEMQAKLRLNGVPVLFSSSITLTVPASTTDLTTVTNYPTDLVEPIALFERDPGQAAQDFKEMLEVDFLPNINPTSNINNWTWQQQKILVSLSISISEVMIRYNRLLTQPTKVTDAIGVLFGDLYLGYRVAALAVASPTGNKIYGMRYAQLDQQANKYLEQVVAMATRQAQNMPAKRRGYHRSRFNFGILLGP